LSCLQSRPVRLRCDWTQATGVSAPLCAVAPPRMLSFALALASFVVSLRLTLREVEHRPLCQILGLAVAEFGAKGPDALMRLNLLSHWPCHLSS